MTSLNDKKTSVNASKSACLCIGCFFMTILGEIYLLDVWRAMTDGRQLGLYGTDCLRKKGACQKHVPVWLLLALFFHMGCKGVVVLFLLV